MRRRYMGAKGSAQFIFENYLTIVSTLSDLAVSLSTSACEYCVDGDGNWKALAAGTATERINPGQFLSFRGELTPTINYGIGTFTIDQECNILGNCLSMLFGDNAKSNHSLEGKDGAFCALFKNCRTIKSVSTSFLPATTLANSCYKDMFSGCTSLRRSPDLPATELARDCYTRMFSGCNSLKYIKAMFTTTPSSYYTSNWVNSVASSGTFVKNKNATWNVTGVNGVPSGWTIQKV